VVGGAGVVGAGVVGAVVTVRAASAALGAAGLVVPTRAPAFRLVAATGVDDEGDEEAAAAMPMTSTSAQNTRNPMSPLCLAAQGFGPCGPPCGR
jgi:hypothetical protein